MRRPTLNHTYRLVWNHVTQAFVPAAETARGRGKSGRKALVEAVAGAVLALGAGSALATACPGGGHEIVISSTIGQCNLGADDSLTITGSGQVTGSGNPAIQVNGITTGAILNQGSVAGTSIGVNVINASQVDSITNAAGGRIFITSGTSGPAAPEMSGISVSNSSTSSGAVVGTISNAGNINIYNFNNNNTTHGLLSGIKLEGNVTGDGIDNSGTINILNYTPSIAGMQGIAVRGAQVDGDVSNGGTISSAGSFSGSLAGYSSVGIAIQGGGSGGGWSGSTVSGTVANSGTISGFNAGIGIRGGSSVGGINNSGRIVGGDLGIGLDNGTVTGDLINSGSGAISADRGIGIYSSSEIHGNVSNRGVIAAASTGINIHSGVVFGSVSNSGVISGGRKGIYVDSASVFGGIVNSGTIAGNNYSIYLGPDSVVDGITITGNDTARFIGQVYAPSTPVTVAAGATYTMQGGELFTVNGPSASGFHNLGTLGVAAGGTGVINGNYTQAAGATLRTYVDSDTRYGKLEVTGTAKLEHDAKIDVKVKKLASLSASSLAGIIHAGTLDSDGTFVTTDDSGLYKFTAVKNGNSVDLNVVKDASLTQITTDAGNRAARGAAQVLDQVLLDPNNPLATAFGSLPTEQLNDAVSQSLPLFAGAAQTAVTGALGDIGRVLQSRLESGRGQSSGDAFYTDGHVWLKPFGSWADQDDRNGVSGYDVKTVGLVVGVDGKLSDSTRAGLSFAYAKADIDGNSSVAPNSADVDVFQLLGYGSHSLDQNTDIDFQVGIGQNQNSGERRIGFVHRTAKSDYDSWTGTLGAGISRHYSLSETASFTPSIRADYTWIKDDSYREHGAEALDLKVKGRTTDTLVAVLDGKFSFELQPSTVLSANLGVGYDLLNSDSSITATYAGAPGAAFRTSGVDTDEWLLRGGVGLSKTVGATEMSLRYDMEHRLGFLNQSASVKVRWAF